MKFILVVITILCCSCNDTSEFVYSCNKATNSWVRDNIARIQTFKRTDWLKYPPSISIAIYRAFTPTQKINFWKDKLKEVESLSWNAEELQHIRRVWDFIESHQHLFKTRKLTDAEEEELDQFFYEWVLFSQDVLNWDKNTAYAIVCTGYPLESKDGKGNTGIISPKNLPSESVTIDTYKDCNCRLDHSFACLGGPDECKKADCELCLGCGWLCLQTCNGKCDL